MRRIIGIVAIALAIGMFTAAGCKTAEPGPAKPAPAAAAKAPEAGTGKIGDPAPPLKVGEWVKGKPVDLKAGQGKNVYVVEFWATWCGPCKASIPHITEMQKKHKDKGVVFIGISSSDKDLATVKDFVKEQGDKMAYTVAYEDKGDGTTYKAYMKAFNQNGIPHAFVIGKDGKIIWHGHPMELDEPLEKIVAGKFDLAAAKTMEKERADAAAAADKLPGLKKTYFDMVRTAGGAKSARKTGDEFLKAAGKNSMALNDFAWTLLTDENVKDRDMDLGTRVAQAAYDACDGKEAAIVDTYARALHDTGKLDEAIKHQKKAVELCKDETMKKDIQEALDRYLKESKSPGEQPKKERAEAAEKLPATAEEAREEYFKLVGAGGDAQKAKKIGEQFLKLAGKDAGALNDFAWTLLTEPAVKTRDLELGMRVAKAAYDACDGKDAAIVDTYARALHDTGKLDDAIKYQKKAVELCEDETMKKDIQDALDRYQKEAETKKK